MKREITLRADVIDTWNMTVTPVPGTFPIVKQSDYVWADQAGRSIALPGRPSILLRLRVK